VHTAQTVWQAGRQAGLSSQQLKPISGEASAAISVVIWDGKARLSASGATTVSIVHIHHHHHHPPRRLLRVVHGGGGRDEEIRGAWLSLAVHLDASVAAKTEAEQIWGLLRPAEAAEGAVGAEGIDYRAGEEPGAGELRYAGEPGAAPPPGPTIRRMERALEQLRKKREAAAAAAAQLQSSSSAAAAEEEEEQRLGSSRARATAPRGARPSGGAGRQGTRVPPPEHNFPDRNSELTEIYLRF
jgi:hypothetical protein